MTLTIDLTPEEAARLEAAARQEGMLPADMARKLLAEHLPALAPAADPRERVRALLARRQADDHTPTIAVPYAQEGLTPTEALFKQWEEEDAALTEEECEAQARLWEEFRQGIDSERERAGMRKLF